MKKNLLIFSLLFSLIFSLFCSSNATESTKLPADSQVDTSSASNVQNEKILYFLIKINGNVVGYERVKTWENNYLSFAGRESYLKLYRFNHSVEMKNETVIAANKQGDVTQVNYVDHSGSADMQNISHYTLVVSPDSPNKGTVSVSKNGAAPQTKPVTLSNVLTSHIQLRNKFKNAYPFKEGVVIDEYQFDCASNQITKNVYTYLRTYKKEVMGKVIDCHAFKFQNFIGNVVLDGAVEIDSNFDIVFSSYKIMGMEQTCERGDASVMQAEVSTHDVLKPTFIHVPPETMQLKYQKMKALRYDFSVEKGNACLDNFSSDNIIRLEKKSERDYSFIVYDPKPAEKMAWPYKGDDTVAKTNLQSTLNLEVDAPEMKQLVKKMLRAESGDDAYEAAAKISRAVFHYIVGKNYRHSYNTALQTLQYREGDCTEHSVLAVALCRAAGIPARPVFGLSLTGQQEEAGYASNYFIGHQWFEVWINGQWYPLDPALYHYDLFHIRLNIGDGSENDNIKMLEGFEQINGIKIKAVTPIK